MTWNEIKQKYVDKWLLIEAITTRTENGRRHLEQMSVIREFSESSSAFNMYKQLHQEQPIRELYVFHTSREELEVVEQSFIGVRGLR
ncbi:MAG TPA: hypothetical protein VGE40_13020 [Bacilli bacterium]